MGGGGGILKLQVMRRAKFRPRCGAPNAGNGTGMFMLEESLFFFRKGCIWQTSSRFMTGLKMLICILVFDSGSTFAFLHKVTHTYLTTESLSIGKNVHRLWKYFETPFSHTRTRDTVRNVSTYEPSP